MTLRYFSSSQYLSRFSFQKSFSKSEKIFKNVLSFFHGGGLFVSIIFSISFSTVQNTFHPNIFHFSFFDGTFLRNFLVFHFCRNYRTGTAMKSMMYFLIIFFLVLRKGPKARWDSLIRGRKIN